jgi:chromosome segregation ATPase
MFALIFAAAVVFWGSVLGGGFYFARRHVRALERRARDESELAELRQRVAHLEEALDGTQRDVERLEAAQEFMNRLLAGRRSGSDA